MKERLYNKMENNVKVLMAVLSVGILMVLIGFLMISTDIDPLAPIVMIILGSTLDCIIVEDFL